MQIWFSRIDPKTHRMVVERPPHPRVDVVLETRSLLVHDFAHWAVETALCTDAGFYGHLAAGVSLDALREPLPDEAVQKALMDIERQVAMLQGAFRKERAGQMTGADTLRRLDGAWRKTKQGEALVVTWPEPAPAVIAMTARVGSPVAT